MEKRKILITGCGRSGTAYVTEMLNELGVQIGHETDGVDGVASWLMTVNDPAPPFGPSRNEYEFDYIFHQVRNPVNVISSAQTITEKSWQYIEKYIPINSDDSLVVKCAKYWYYWNLKAEEQSFMTYKIEDFLNVAKCIIDITNIGEYNMNKIYNKTKKVNTRTHNMISLNDLKQEDCALADDIISLAIRYGYKKSELSR